MNTQCPKCNTSAQSHYQFCPTCGTPIPSNKLQLEPNLEKMPERYRNSYGIWSVTTEGDCEGRTTKQLGTYEGHIDEIAKALSGKCYYSLRFTVAKELPIEEIPEHGKVNISLDIDSGTWDMNKGMRAAVIGEILKAQLVTVSPATLYAGVTLEW